MDIKPIVTRISEKCIELSPDAYKYSEGKPYRIHPDNRYWPAFERLCCLEGVYAQIRWERDVAVKQLNDLGYAFGEKVDTEPENPKEQLDQYYCEIGKFCLENGIAPEDLLPVQKAKQLEAQIQTDLN